ncbi:glycoside hydrolase family 18 [Bacteroides ovatus]|uniref:glycoside hydrolase family 18 n=1 Tax=Bacteroides ovatus TaxID=28116 RepID=UPI00216648D5|nr:glycoside hydrolase family 18 [Bacteroides ovatus]MCS2930559.1 glycoside hydrolase family 18 [Bacteroides ovatus]
MAHKRILKAILLSTASVIILSACSDWTEPDSLDINLQELDTERYEAHLTGVRAYKKSDHKIMVMKMDNNSLPKGRADHLTSVPDSIDYVVLNTYDNLSSEVAAEINEVRDRKGIKTLIPIDFQNIEAAFEKQIGQKKVKVQEEDAASPVDPFIVFCEQQINIALTAYATYGHAGINVIYNGIFPLSLPNEEQKILKKRQEFFIDKIVSWVEAHPEATLIFEGKPQNMFGNTSWLEKAKYVTINIKDASTVEEQLIAVEMAKVEGVPEDRLLLEVDAIVAGNKEGEGFLTSKDENGNLTTSLQGAVQILSRKDASYLQGICVNHAQYDYYYADKVYKNIRAALYAISHL